MECYVLHAVSSRIHMLLNGMVLREKALGKYLGFDEIMRVEPTLEETNERITVKCKETMSLSECRFSYPRVTANTVF